MQLPTSPNEIIQERVEIERRVLDLQHELQVEQIKMETLQKVCQHPEQYVKRWHSNPMGRWPTNHFQCAACGLHKET